MVWYKKNTNNVRKYKNSTMKNYWCMNYERMNGALKVTLTHNETFCEPASNFVLPTAVYSISSLIRGAR